MPRLSDNYLMDYYVLDEKLAKQDPNAKTDDNVTQQNLNSIDTSYTTYSSKGFDYIPTPYKRCCLLMLKT